MARFLALPVLLFSAGAALAATVEEDVQRYLEIMAGNPARHADELEKLSSVGLSDTRLFDVIEQRLLADVESARSVHVEKNRVAWYFRALGFSGQEKYRPTLAKYVDDRVYRNYAINAQRDLAEYAHWNPVISNRASFDPNLSDEANRLMNMLRSTDMSLVKIGAKRAYFTEADEPVLDLVAEQVKARYRTSDLDNADTVAWMVKALGRDRSGRYSQLLGDVRDYAADRTVRHQAGAQLRARSASR